MVHKELEVFYVSPNWVDFAPLLFALEHFMSTKTDSINHVNPSEVLLHKIAIWIFAECSATQ